MNSVYREEEEFGKSRLYVKSFRGRRTSERETRDILEEQRGRDPRGVEEFGKGDGFMGGEQAGGGFWGRGLGQIEEICRGEFRNGGAELEKIWRGGTRGFLGGIALWRRFGSEKGLGSRFPGREARVKKQEGFFGGKRIGPETLNGRFWGARDFYFYREHPIKGERR